MVRAKLRTKTGCNPCRVRRKKCDEDRPSCKACQRLKIECSYGIRQLSRNTEVTVRPDDDMSQVLPARVPDHKGSPSNTSAERVIRILSATEYTYNNAPVDQHRSVEGLLIEGVCDDWQKLLGGRQPDQILTRDQCRLLSDLDRYLQDVGHGQVARIIFAWHYHRLSQYLFASDSSMHDGVPMASWFIESRNYNDHFEPSIVTHIPWSRVRDRLNGNPKKYCTIAWMTSLMNAIRFLWPDSLETALEGGDDRQGTRLSNEALIRANNIRSFVVVKDFLDQHSEFRGEVPQLEPSLTLYAIREHNHLEAMYWKMVYKRRLPLKRVDCASPSVTT